jgi:hypothetical protein
MWPLSQTLRTNFLPLVSALGSRAQFEANYFIYDGRLWGCTAPSLPCGSQVQPAMCHTRFR